MRNLNMNEAFRRWPLGVTTFAAWADLYGAMFHEWNGSSVPFDDWLFERLRPLLEASAKYQVLCGEHWQSWLKYTSVGESIRYAITLQNEFPDRRARVIVLDGTVIREWPIDEYDGIF